MFLEHQISFKKFLKKLKNQTNSCFSLFFLPVCRCRHRSFSPLFFLQNKQNKTKQKTRKIFCVLFRGRNCRNKSLSAQMSMRKMFSTLFQGPLRRGITQLKRSTSNWFKFSCEEKAVQDLSQR